MLRDWEYEMEPPKESEKEQSQGQRENNLEAKRRKCFKEGEIDQLSSAVGRTEKWALDLETWKSQVTINHKKAILEKRWVQKHEGRGSMKGQEVRSQIQLFREFCGLKKQKKKKKRRKIEAYGEGNGVQMASRFLFLI